MILLMLFRHLLLWRIVLLMIFLLLIIMVRAHVNILWSFVHLTLANLVQARMCWFCMWAKLRLWKDLLYMRLVIVFQTLMVLDFDLIFIFRFLALMIVLLFFILRFLLSLFIVDLSIRMIVLLVCLLLNLRVHTLDIWIRQELIFFDLLLIVLILSQLILINLVLVLHLSITLYRGNKLILVLWLSKVAVFLRLWIAIYFVTNLLWRPLQAMQMLCTLMLPIQWILETLLSVFMLEIVQRCVSIVVKPVILHRFALLD